MRGRFVVFEGLDGSGTTTQAGLLARRLTDAGIAVEVTREPSTGPFGAILRQAIEGRIVLDARTMALGFAADRADHLFNPATGIVGHLEAGRWVVSDRYVLSSLAYQASQDVELRWLEEINGAAIAPDLTIFLDADEETSMARIGGRSTTDELFHDAGRLRAVRAAYHAAIGQARAVGELLTLDAGGSVEAVAGEVWQGVRDRLL